MDLTITEVKLTVSIPELIKIIAGLHTLPFGQVHELVRKIDAQVVEQNTPKSD